MPVPVLAAAGLGVSVLGGFSKIVGGSRRKRAAMRELRDLQRSRQYIRNVNEGRRISMRGAELAREQIARGQATGIDALQSGGIRGVVGGMQGMQESANMAIAREGAQLDQQQMALDADFAQDEVRMRAMREQRQMQDEATAQAAINAGQQDQMSGLGDIAGSAFSAAALGVSNTGVGIDGDTGVGDVVSGGFDNGLGQMGQLQNAFGSYGSAFANSMFAPKKPTQAQFRYQDPRFS